MTDPARFQKVMRLFEQACALPAAEHDAFVRGSCDGDESVRVEVMAMLAHDARPTHDRPMALLGVAGVGQRLLAAAIDTDDRATRHRSAGTPDHPHEPSTRVVQPSGLESQRDQLPVLAGHYRIIKVIGEGGMGIVYLAEQSRPRRLVALKAIRPGMSSRALLRRFEHEAQMLGRLHHPGIAQIFEAGAADEISPDQAYIAMEYVAGPPMQDFAQSKGLDQRARVELIIRVCDAVHHAHQRGVIHRDLKPNNIHVEDSGQPKVLDFGVARFASDHAEHPHTTMHTQAGQIVGTLAYMSPEQVAGDSDAVDVRSDVYALGVMLYQLLSGRLPLEPGRSGLVEAARMIREDHPLRLGALDRRLRGDLEVIASRALEKDRERRYQSAAELRDDLQRHLDGLPISARQDSAIYVLRRMLRRHRPMVAAALLALAALVAFAAYASMMATRNSDLALRERTARHEADAIARNLERELAISTIERGRMAGQTASLVTGEQLLWSAYARDPDSRHVHWALWELYSRAACRATHETAVTAIAGMSVSPDATLIALAGEPSRVEVRSLPDFTIRHVLEVGGARGLAVAFSPDGRLLATGNDRGSVCIWNIADMSRSTEHAGTGQAVRSIAWKPDGSQIAWTTGDMHLQTWNMDERRAPESFPAQGVRPMGGATPQLEFSPDGRYIVVFGIDGAIRFLNADDPQQVVLTLTGHSDRVFAIAFSPDQRTLFSGSNDRDIREWDLANATCRATLTAPNGLVRNLRLSEDGRTLLSAGWWTLDTWDVASRTRTRAIPLPTGAFALWWSPDQTTAFTGHSTGVVREWDLAPPTFAEYAGHAGRCAATISRDGALTAVGDGEGRVTVRDRATGSILWATDAHARRVHALQFDPSANVLLTAGLDGMLRLWNARDGGMLREIKGVNATTIDAASFSNDGSRLVAAWSGAAYRVLNAADLSTLATFKHGPSEALCARFSDDDQMIVTTARETMVRVWTADGQPVVAIPTSETPWVARFAPDGRRIAAGNWGRAVEFFDIASASRLARLEGHNGLVSGVAFGPGDQGIVASAAADGTVRLWDVDDPRNLLNLKAFDVEAITVELSADGRWMIAASADGQAKVWDLRRFDRHIAGNQAHNLRLIAGDPPKK